MPNHGDIMESIGNATDAAFIYEWVRESKGDYNRPTDKMRQNPPKGWTYLGEGCYRSTWRSPEGVAYKVQHSYNGWGQSNSAEYTKLSDAWKCDPVEGVRLPRGELFPIEDEVDVIAMECVAGKTVDKRWNYWNTPDKVSDLMEFLSAHYNIIDMHSGNVMVDDETDELIPIDFGY